MGSVFRVIVSMRLRLLEDGLFTVFTEIGKKKNYESGDHGKDTSDHEPGPEPAAHSPGKQSRHERKAENGSETKCDQ